MEGKKGIASSEIFETLGDFTSKENWDKFFTLRGTGDTFEWYAEWPELRDPLISELQSSSASDGAADFQILVPGCGSSRVSEYLYDAGFRRTTNIDFSKVVVSDMLHRYVRSKPEMRWRVMDMTDLQFADDFFDAILDKGGLDALMEPEYGSKLGIKYLKEVKRVLKSGGKFLCLTLAESHVLDVLFTELRFGWETSIHSIPQKPGSKPTFQTFMVVTVKEKLVAPNLIKLLFDQHSIIHKGGQVHALLNAVENENRIRSGYTASADIMDSLKDLQLGAKGALNELVPGRRCQTILGEQGSSLFHYKAVLLDSHQLSEPFLYHCGVFIVPKARAHEWLFTSEEGQWLIVESSKAARLIMIFLDSSHTGSSMDDIQKDLSPLVRNLAPGKADDEARIPFMMAGDGIKQRNIVHEVTSAITGHIIVEDVIYDNADGDPSELKLFRRLTFGRSSSMVQSEALLSQEAHSKEAGTDRKRNVPSSRTRTKRGKKRSDSYKLIDGSKVTKVDHSCLASLYHSGIVSGFALIISALELAVSSGKKIRTYIVGLGAGLLPMFLHACLPFLQLEVVELDPVMLDLATQYFNFVEDDRMKVHIGDGIRFIEDANVIKSHEQETDGTCPESLANGNSSGIKILIVDADSSDLSSGLSCPPSDFVEESFLLQAKNFLSEGGLFVINLVSRSPAIREKVVLRLKAAFSQLFSLELEEDVNEVLFASPRNVCIDVDQLQEAVAKLRSLMKFPLPDGQIEPGKFKCLK
ncbi:Methyltransferase domain [Musa troglodytarum]|uniref:Methyltransferase domain n=1 Tax=Musa troglodytarum TaxID=320322 RepID=A0A9E7EAG6_9LILI|nr:Methyltransferase domain [Musa troglodytarum]